MCERKGVAGVCRVSRCGPVWVTRRLAGAVGIDTNEDHLGLAETDRVGDLVRIRRIGRNLEGKSEEQAKKLFY
ncbi:hypothetical protein MPNT_50113 [Candidatus Methylacidithermus pantelleriae]|uniref:Uncharacterized protein n=1 Tax=Candidatus Methylacidithermus pantelleriae TaxID=2744239 RepID=A0A8J2FTI2_9BACT|nr:hypothetical protein MPNT_50113 [Candidatus Methylacidithermus pantelleriae]